MLRTWTPHAAIMNRAMSQMLGVNEGEPPSVRGVLRQNDAGKKLGWRGPRICRYPPLPVVTGSRQGSSAFARDAGRLRALGRHEHPTHVITERSAVSR